MSREMKIVWMVKRLNQREEQEQERDSQAFIGMPARSCPLPPLPTHALVLVIIVISNGFVCDLQNLRICYLHPQKQAIDFISLISWLVLVCLLNYKFHKNSRLQDVTNFRTQGYRM